MIPYLETFVTVVVWLMIAVGSFPLCVLYNPQQPFLFSASPNCTIHCVWKLWSLDVSALLPEEAWGRTQRRHKCGICLRNFLPSTLTVCPLTYNSCFCHVHLRDQSNIDLKDLLQNWDANCSCFPSWLHILDREMQIMWAQGVFCLFLILCGYASTAGVLWIQFQQSLRRCSVDREVKNLMQGQMLN